MSDLQLLLARDGVRIGLCYHCGRCKTPDDVAQYYGLRKANNAWHDVDRSQATTLLRELLEHDLAYWGEADSTPIATDVAQDFVAEFAEETRFFTNAQWQERNGVMRVGSTGFAATESTFDSGIIALHDHKMGVYWVEGED